MHVFSDSSYSQVVECSKNTASNTSYYRPKVSFYDYYLFRSKFLEGDSVISWIAYQNNSQETAYDTYYLDFRKFFLNISKRSYCHKKRKHHENSIGNVFGEWHQWVQYETIWNSSHHRSMNKHLLDVRISRHRERRIRVNIISSKPYSIEHSKNFGSKC